MRSNSLKTRYVLTVLVVGILLTASVALALYFEGRLTLVIGIGSRCRCSPPASPRR
jgi:hypothetical protein